MHHRKDFVYNHSTMTEEMNGEEMKLADFDDMWQSAQLPGALQTIAESGKAVLGAEVCVIVDGKRQEFFPGSQSMHVWDTRPRKADEPWPEYCRRAFEQSLKEVEQLSVLEEAVDAAQRSYVYYHVTYAPEFDAKLLVPRNKMDEEWAEAAVKAGYPAVEPVLAELLEWLQDLNWPVAYVLAPFLADIGEPLIPHIRKIFLTDDEEWKYCIIVAVIAKSAPVAQAMRDELERIAASPTAREIEAELDQEAKLVLAKYSFEP